MSHEIQERDDVMLSKTAWHRLGQVVGRAFSWLDAVAAGLPITHNVVKVPMSELIIGYETQADEYAAVDEATGFVIHSGHGEQWTPFPASHGYEFGEAMRGEAGGINANLLSLGTLRNLRQWFMTYDLGRFDVCGYECCDYLTVSGSYDSSRQLLAVDSPTLVVCANTLAASDFGMKLYKFKHTSGIFDRVDEAKRAMQLHRINQAALIETCEHLGSTALSPSLFSELLCTLFEVDTEKQHARTVNVNTEAREAVTALYKGFPLGSQDQAVTDGARNGFTFVQAVNTYEQWHAPVRKTKGVDTDTARALRQLDSMTAGTQPLTAQAIKLVQAVA